MAKVMSPTTISIGNSFRKVSDLWRASARSQFEES